MSSVLATREDIIQCYRIILGRQPENEAVVAGHLAKAQNLWELIAGFVHSPELTLMLLKQDNFVSHKYYQRDYLAKSLPIGVNGVCFFYNYAFLFDRILLSAFEAIMRGDVPLFEQVVGPTKYTVVLNISQEYQNEGELSLELKANDMALYILSFSVIPGRVVALADRDVILISRMQGRHVYTEARQARKDLNEVSPQALLYAVLRGVATAIGVDKIVCVSGVNQVFYKPEQDEYFKQSYDEFLASIDAVALDNGFYLTSVSTPEKPINLVKPGHRLRTKAKRKFKNEVAEAAREAWISKLARPGGASEGGEVGFEEAAEGADGLQGKLDRTLAALAEAHRVAGDRALEMEKLRADLNRAETAVLGAQDRFEQLRIERDRLRQEYESALAKVKGELAKVYATRSWRLTAPFRAINAWRSRTRRRLARALGF